MPERRPLEPIVASHQACQFRTRGHDRTILHRDAVEPNQNAAVDTRKRAAEAGHSVSAGRITCSIRGKFEGSYARDARSNIRVRSFFWPGAKGDCSAIASISERAISRSSRSSSIWSSLRFSDRLQESRAPDLVEYAASAPRALGRQ